jgi:hypothetical protein
VSRTGARLRDPEAGAPKLGGRGGSGFDMLDLGVPQGRAPRPLEKAGRVGLGYEKTETETISIFMKKFVNEHLFFSYCTFTLHNCISCFVVAIFFSLVICLH